MTNDIDDFPPQTPAERFAAEKEHAKEIFETEFKAVGYLLAANGAGLVGCLSVIKDYNTNPQLHGIGIFISIFAVGFLFAMLSFMAAQQHRSAIMGIFLGKAPKVTISRIVWQSQLPQWISGSALVIAMFCIIHRFGKL